MFGLEGAYPHSQCGPNQGPCKGLMGWNVWTDGISPHSITQYNKQLLSIASNILNANQNSLSSLNVQYIGYFYLHYSILTKIFPNLFPQSFITLFINLIKYINCSLIKFKSYIRYFISCISQSLTSDLANIQSLTTLIPQLPELIERVLCKLKAAIGLNITLVCLQLSIIRGSIICCNKCIDSSVKIINCIITLICKCKITIISCLLNCLKKIKCKLLELHDSNLRLLESYGYINYLKNQTQNIINCFNDISTLKAKICELTKKFECSLTEFNKIECCIKCAKSKISQIKEIIESIQSNNGTITFKVRSEKKLTAYISKVNDSNGNKQLIKCLIEQIKCLGQKIDKACSQFEKIEDNTTDLKHSLLFNWYYFQISFYILNEVECIETQQKRCEKLSNIKDVESGISVISDNIRDVRSVIDRINERRDDLEYIREGLFSIIPKLCQIRESANKIPELKSVIEALKKIESSIEKLKVIDSEQKCLQIFECADKNILKYSLIYIRDKLDIKSITDKLEIVKNGIPSLENVICNSKKLEPCIEKIENNMKYIVGWIDEVNKFLDNIIKRFIMCSLLSLTNHTGVTVINDNKYYEEVYGLYSLMNVMDYEVVVNRLFACAKKIDQILQLIPWYDSCQCILRSLSFLNYPLLIIKV